MMIVMVFCHKHSGNDEVDDTEEDDFDEGDWLFLRSDPWMIDYQSWGAGCINLRKCLSHKNDRTGMQNKQKFTMHKNKGGNVLRFSLTWDKLSWVQDGWPSLPPKNFYSISSYLRLIILSAIYRAKTRNTGRIDSKYSFRRNLTLIYFFIVHPLTPLMVWWTQVGVCKLINSHIEKNMSGHYANIRNYQCKTVDISQYFKSKLRTH